MQRISLADSPLGFLDGEILNHRDPSWVAEAERLYADYHEGKWKPIPAVEVLAEADRITE
jgi:hypothetical protein